MKNGCRRYCTVTVTVAVVIVFIIIHQKRTTLRGFTHKRCKI